MVCICVRIDVHMCVRLGVHMCVRIVCMYVGWDGVYACLTVSC